MEVTAGGWSEVSLLLFLLLSRAHENKGKRPVLLPKVRMREKIRKVRYLDEFMTDFYFFELYFLGISIPPCLGLKKC